MTYTIDEFKNRFAKGVARANRYVVTITPPKGLLLQFSLSQDLTIACESVELPGSQLATGEDKQFGPIRKIPYLNIYTDLAIRFICSDDLRERYFFDAWQDLVLKRDDIVGSTTKESFKVGFYDDYVTTISIKVLNQKNETQYTIKCHEVWPIDVLNQPLSYGNTDDYMRLEVNLAYRNWTTENYTFI